MQILPEGRTRQLSWTKGGEAVSTVVSLVVAAAIGGLSYFYLGKDLLLAVWTALAFFALVRTGIALLQMRPGVPSRGGVFGGVLTGMIAGAALLGVSPFLPIEPELRLALQLLVMGTGFASAAVTALFLLRSLNSKAHANDKREPPQNGDLDHAG